MTDRASHGDGSGKQDTPGQPVAITAASVTVTRKASLRRMGSRGSFRVSSSPPGASAPGQPNVPTRATATSAAAAVASASQAAASGRQASDDGQKKGAATAAAARREELLRNGRVREVLDGLWGVTTDHSGQLVNKDQYVLMHLNLQLAMLGSLDAENPRTRAQAEADWKTDCRGKPELTFPNFAQAWFQLAARWVDLRVPPQVASFLETLYARLVRSEGRTLVWAWPPAPEEDQPKDTPPKRPQSGKRKSRRRKGRRKGGRRRGSGASNVSNVSHRSSRRNSAARMAALAAEGNSSLSVSHIGRSKPPPSRSVTASLRRRRHVRTPLGMSQANVRWLGAPAAAYGIPGAGPLVPDAADAALEEGSAGSVPQDTMFSISSPKPVATRRTSKARNGGAGATNTAPDDGGNNTLTATQPAVGARPGPSSQHRVGGFTLPRAPTPGHRSAEGAPGERRHRTSIPTASQTRGLSATLGSDSKHELGQRDGLGRPQTADGHTIGNDHTPSSRAPRRLPGMRPLSGKQRRPASAAADPSSRRDRTAKKRNDGKQPRTAAAAVPLGNGDSEVIVAIARPSTTMSTASATPAPTLVQSPDGHVAQVLVLDDGRRDASDRPPSAISRVSIHERPGSAARTSGSMVADSSKRNNSADSKRNQRGRAVITDSMGLREFGQEGRGAHAKGVEQQVRVRRVSSPSANKRLNSADGTRRLPESVGASVEGIPVRLDPAMLPPGMTTSQGNLPAPLLVPEPLSGYRGVSRDLVAVSPPPTRDTVLGNRPMSPDPRLALKKGQQGQYGVNPLHDPHQPRRETPPRYRDVGAQDGNANVAIAADESAASLNVAQDDPAGMVEWGGMEVHFGVEESGGGDQSAFPMDDTDTYLTPPFDGPLSESEPVERPTKGSPVVSSPAPFRADSLPAPLPIPKSKLEAMGRTVRSPSPSASPPTRVPGTPEVTSPADVRAMSPLPSPPPTLKPRQSFRDKGDVAFAPISVSHQQDFDDYGEFDEYDGAASPVEYSSEQRRDVTHGEAAFYGMVPSMRISRSTMSTRPANVTELSRKIASKTQRGAVGTSPGMSESASLPLPLPEDLALLLPSDQAQVLVEQDPSLATEQAHATALNLEVAGAELPVLAKRSVEQLPEAGTVQPPQLALVVVDRAEPMDDVVNVELPAPANLVDDGSFDAAVDVDTIDAAGGGSYAAQHNGYTIAVEPVASDAGFLVEGVPAPTAAPPVPKARVTSAPPRRKDRGGSSDGGSTDHVPAKGAAAASQSGISSETATEQEHASAVKIQAITRGKQARSTISLASPDARPFGTVATKGDSADPLVRPVSQQTVRPKSSNAIRSRAVRISNAKAPLSEAPDSSLGADVLPWQSGSMDGSIGANEEHSHVASMEGEPRARLESRDHEPRYERLRESRWRPATTGNTRTRSPSPIKIKGVHMTSGGGLPGHIDPDRPTVGVVNHMDAADLLAIAGDDHVRAVIDRQTGAQYAALETPAYQADSGFSLVRRAELALEQEDESFQRPRVQFSETDRPPSTGKSQRPTSSVSQSASTLPHLKPETVDALNSLSSLFAGISLPAPVIETRPETSASQSKGRRKGKSRRKGRAKPREPDHIDRMLEDPLLGMGSMSITETYGTTGAGFVAAIEAQGNFGVYSSTMFTNRPPQATHQRATVIPGEPGPPAGVDNERSSAGSLW